MKVSKLEEKRGISLIVLVITIIVMIILATAIILSLSNSGIIEKANKAKTDSDTANLEEYVNVLRAEYGLMSDVEKEDKTFVQFANSKLEEKGYERKLAENGALMNENATVAVKEGIQVGDVVGYNQFLIQKSDAEKSYTTDGSEQSSTGMADSTKKQTVKTNTSYVWRYIGISEEGDLLIAPDVPAGTINTEYKLTLGDKGCYLNGPRMLNSVCDALYTVDKKGKAQSIDIDIINKLLEYSGPKGSYKDVAGNTVETPVAKTIGEVGLISSLGSNIQTPDGKDINTYKLDYYNIGKTSYESNITKNEVKQNLVFQGNEYWLASPCARADFSASYVRFDVRCVNSDGVRASGMFSSDGTVLSRTFVIRPVVSLDPSIQLVKDTSAANTWKIQ